MNYELAKLLGSNIKKVRKNKAINQEQLALLTSIDRSYIGRIERGEVTITVEKLYEIAKILEVMPQSLLP
ncbi:MAG TPA: helix-turn-helix transcriptional regulator [Acinetobacter parvus]|jgi:transcriptional regulator with XRE-family HTH domain|uniref:helix-turn-helix domain-containing protein n=1 Tax=Acinetobacter parvus TaxID=134533 RepID=UPI002BE88998|nr:helix-turn-helix transcriptional regulator [Acinetobacter parvus]HRM16495.1 helix-turn-helix transcriptional regulator [Acinetobacter parvus]